MNTYKKRIDLLRAEMKKEKIDCYIVFSEDYHSSEYVSDYFQERAWLSGFDGSAGTLLITQSEARLWTDGRYFIQARQQLDGSGILLMETGEPGVPYPDEYIISLLENSSISCIGYDGRTMKYSFSLFLKDKIRQSGNECAFAIDSDLVDRIWNDRPAFPSGHVWKLDEKYAGRGYAEKLSDLRKAVLRAGCKAILLTDLTDIAWLYNFRGSDVAYTPVTMAYSLVTQDSATLYINHEIDLDGVIVKPYFSVYNDIKAFGETLLVDKSSVNEILADSAKCRLIESPVSLAKSIKNETEIKNEIEAHIKDGIALTKTIYWLKQSAAIETYASETELSVEAHLTALRKQQENFVDLSFASIVAAGSNGAIIHYEPTPESSRKIENGFLLIDSGAHYLEGSTDVTRTISIGETTEEMKANYTAVLRGHLNLSSALFPIGTTGSCLDRIARMPIQERGLDYKHGTGHGVGYLLSVHEGPCSIRKPSRNVTSNLTPDPELHPGNILSNEPGIYIENKYGIRIENLLLCEKHREFESNDLLCFKDLTLAPYDKASILLNSLSDEELSALKSYSQYVFDTLSPYLTKDESAWLKEETTFLL